MKDKVENQANIQNNPCGFVRRNPEEYVGKICEGTLYVLLKEMIDNSVNEYIRHHGEVIRIERHDDAIEVSDNGSGFPSGKMVPTITNFTRGVTFNSDEQIFSEGLHGMGCVVTIALSQSFTITSTRDGKCETAVFEEGRLIFNQVTTKSDGRVDGTTVSFVPDKHFFGGLHFDDAVIDRMVREYAYLNSGLTVVYNGVSYRSERGLADLLSEETDCTGLYDMVYYKSPKLEFAFTHFDGVSGEILSSYVNGIRTRQGGTHLVAFRDGIVSGINAFFGHDWKYQCICEGLVGVISVRMVKPVFRDNSKDMLTTSDIRASIANEVKDAVIGYLQDNESLATLLERVISNNQMKLEEDEP